ncbi:MAG TPA: 2-oxoacid:acceptor oxidoreductase subunit alpha [Acidimicrobiales bacterium]|nr:2-oxoacid:acceptor oxidoreductase subunit alpha [Acidimicrobiales bacterium]
MTDTQRQPIHELEKVVIRFAGDSGDGIQLTGDRFSVSSALFGNDLVTVPDYPAEIRAPAGTLAGVSAFQIHISDHDILTPGDAPNVLVAMNPAALRANLGDMAAGSTLIVNVDSLVDRSLAKAGYDTNPLTDGSLNGFTVYEVPMTSLTIEAAKPSGAKGRDAERAKNFFALGLLSWMYSRPAELTLRWIEQRFAKAPEVAGANTLAFKAGYNFGETAELVGGPFEVKPTHFRSGTYTNINGNTALAWGLVAAGQLAKLPVFLASYPITPASDILHELSKRQNFGVRTMQAEDEIAAVGAALGAAYGGHLGVTTTSGPGMDLKAETIGLGISLELPLVVIDVQRGGPSTGLPTKTEQSDLLMAMYGRHGEAPVPIIAPKTPGDCFYAAIEAARLALKYRTPVILLSDGYLANSAEPWRLPDVAALPDISVSYASMPNSTAADGSPEFLPYLRDVATRARPWAVPGTPGLEHRIGGLEKADRTGAISYDPANHELMVRMRADKVAGIAADIPPVDLDDPTGDADVLVLGWGSTYGAIGAAVERLRRRGKRVGRAHLTHLHPFPADLGDVLARYRRVIVPEMNLGQLTAMVRAACLVDARPVTKVQGQRFLFSEIEAAVLALMEDS